MRLRWPWIRSNNEEKSPRRDVIKEEQDAMRRDIGQIKQVNRHLLAKALKDHWFDQDTVESIRTIQMDEERPDGTDPPKS